MDKNWTPFVKLGLTVRFLIILTIDSRKKDTNLIGLVQA